jgi:heme exporter protein B
MKKIGAFGVFAAVVRRDLTLAMRQKSEVLTTLFFFVIVASLFPLGVGAEKQLLGFLGPGVVWVAALLASMLALERLFASDYADGTLEQMLLTPQPLSVLVLGKVFAHWLLTGVPLVVVAPLLGLQYGLDGTALAVMALALLLGTPVLSLVGAIGAALTLGLRGGGILLSLLILPLYIPVLIYGSGAVTVSAIDLADVRPFLALLGAFLVLALAFAPLATAAALRISLE